eukprot:SAG11_NODE_1331_length_5186_cov_3.907608_4_plen_336_part_00
MIKAPAPSPRPPPHVARADALVRVQARFNDTKAGKKKLKKLAKLEAKGHAAKEKNIFDEGGAPPPPPAPPPVAPSAHARPWRQVENPLGAEESGGGGEEGGGSVSPRGGTRLEGPEATLEGMGSSFDTMANAADQPASPRLSAAEAAELKAFAENYEPSYIRSVHSSLICIFVKQVPPPLELRASSEDEVAPLCLPEHAHAPSPKRHRARPSPRAQAADFRTLSALQTLKLKRWPSDDQREALYKLAPDIEKEVFDSVLWLWCNGAGAPQVRGAPPPLPPGAIGEGGSTERPPARRQLAACAGALDAHGELRPVHDRRGAPARRDRAQRERAAEG